VDDRIINTLTAIKDMYGDGVFYNLTTVKNMMNDLAPHLRKERIQIANFLEIGGYFQLKYAEQSYQLVRNRLYKQYRETFAVDASVANWVLNVFSVVLGFSISDEGAVYKGEPAPPRKPTITEIKQAARPYIGDERRPLMKVPATKKIQIPNTRPKFGNREFAQRLAADYHSVAVVKNGFVKATGLNTDGQCFTNTYDWRDIIAVSTGAYYTVGIRADGTTIGTGRYEFKQRDMLGWSNIKVISAGTRHTVGLRGDGTLLACGQNKHGECNIQHWRNIVHVVAGDCCTFAIKKDKRVLVSGDNKNGDLQVSHLENVADIAYGGPGRIIALLEDGTIARVGQENHMRKNFSHIKGVKQIAAAPDYIAALMDNGTVKLLAYFWQDSGVEAATVDWTDIIAIAAGRYHILGWRSDGKLISAMLHPDISKNQGQLNINRWEM